MVNTVLDGFNATLMAYGQTGSGKTYTMAGNLVLPLCLHLCVSQAPCESQFVTAFCFAQDPLLHKAPCKIRTRASCHEPLHRFGIPTAKFVGLASYRNKAEYGV